VLGHWRPFWTLLNRSQRLGKIVNKLIINNAVKKTRNRPNPYSTLAPYTSWASLTDLTWFSRHLPPKPQDGLPEISAVTGLFSFDSSRSPVSSKSTLLFPSFAQWFTDGFLLTQKGLPRRTKTNHAIDLSPLYGLNSGETNCIRTLSERRGEKGRLKSEIVNGEEYAPTMFDAAGNRKTEFAPLPVPLALPDDWPLAKKSTIFAFAGERANSTPMTAMLNTLFLREHNRLCAMLEESHPEWDDERVFQTARNINIAQLIKIVVEEYINHISPYYFKLRADPSVCWHADWYRANWIAVEFNLLYRWHSLVPDQILWDGAMVDTTQMIFDHSHLTRVGVRRAVAMTSSHPSWHMGLFNTAKFLVRFEEHSVQQGRDNELASYNDYREAMGYPRVARFEQINGDPGVVEALRRVYGDVDKIEFYVGLFAEERPPLSAVPPLLGRMVGIDAFSQALTNPLLSEHIFNETTFTPEGFKVIKETSRIEDLVRRNTPASDVAVFASMTQRQR
jgi:prostaglandin-endoperoxide synthase 2